MDQPAFDETTTRPELWGPYLARILASGDTEAFTRAAGLAKAVLLPAGHGLFGRAMTWGITGEDPGYRPCGCCS